MPFWIMLIVDGDMKNKSISLIIQNKSQFQKSTP